MGAVNEVGVDAAGGGGGGVAQGFADIEEGHALEGGNGGKGVAQAVEGDPGRSFFRTKRVKARDRALGE